MKKISKVSMKPMYCYVNGERYKMDITKSGNYIAHDVYLLGGENFIHFADAKNSCKSRIAYIGNENPCLIHKFNMTNESKHETVLYMNEDFVADVLVMPKSDDSYDMQVRFPRWK